MEEIVEEWRDGGVERLTIGEKLNSEREEVKRIERRFG